MKVWALWAEYPHPTDQATVCNLEGLYTSHQKATQEKEKQAQEDVDKESIDRAYEYWIVDIEVE